MIETIRNQGLTSCQTKTDRSRITTSRTNKTLVNNKTNSRAAKVQTSKEVTMSMSEKLEQELTHTSSFVSETSEIPSQRLLDTSWLRPLKKSCNSSWTLRSTKIHNSVSPLESQKLSQREESPSLTSSKSCKMPSRFCKEIQILLTHLLETTNWRELLPKRWEVAKEVLVDNPWTTRITKWTSKGCNRTTRWTSKDKTLTCKTIRWTRWTNNKGCSNNLICRDHKLDSQTSRPKGTKITLLDQWTNSNSNSRTLNKTSSSNKELQTLETCSATHWERTDCEERIWRLLRKYT